eukprot:ctg_1835.g525
MAGDNCVSIASDHRFGMSQLTLACDAQRIEPLHDRLCVGLAGLATDCTTLAERFRYKHNMYRLREKRVMRPRTFAAVASSTLYEKRFAPYFTEVVIAGLELEEDGKRGTSGADAMTDAVYRRHLRRVPLRHLRDVLAAGPGSGRAVRGDRAVVAGGAGSRLHEWLGRGGARVDARGHHHSGIGGAHGLNVIEEFTSAPPPKLFWAARRSAPTATLSSAHPWPRGSPAPPAPTTRPRAGPAAPAHPAAAWRRCRPGPG